MQHEVPSVVPSCARRAVHLQRQLSKMAIMLLLSCVHCVVLAWGRRAMTVRKTLIAVQLDLLNDRYNRRERKGNLAALSTKIDLQCSFVQSWRARLTCPVNSSGLICLVACWCTNYIIKQQGGHIPSKCCGSNNSGLVRKVRITLVGDR